MVTQYLFSNQVALTVLLQAIGLSNNAWYYQKNESYKQYDESIKSEIVEILEESPYYGYRRVTAELKRNGKNYNHKKILRIMDEYYLVQPRKRPKGFPTTTNSNHDYVIYTNEIQYLGTQLPPGVVWVSDITYIPVGDRWAYLALIMDQGSRKIVGWDLSYSLDKTGAILALEQALENNTPPQYHHSDRGVQYCCHDYQHILKQHNITPSMADVGVSVDNPHAESLNRSIKVEEVYRNEYETIEEARYFLKQYIMRYNTRRLHSSLGYIPPEEYEANYKLQTVS